MEAREASSACAERLGVDVSEAFVRIVNVLSEKGWLDHVVAAAEECFTVGIGRKINEKIRSLQETEAVNLREVVDIPAHIDALKERRGSRFKILKVQDADPKHGLAFGKAEISFIGGRVDRDEGTGAVLHYAHPSRKPKWLNGDGDGYDTIMRVSIAHELGHLLLHSEINGDGYAQWRQTDSVSKELQELQATVFAEMVVLERNKKKPVDPSIIEIASATLWRQKLTKKEYDISSEALSKYRALKKESGFDKVLESVT